MKVSLRRLRGSTRNATGTRCPQLDDRTAAQPHAHCIIDDGAPTYKTGDGTQQAACNTPASPHITTHQLTQLRSPPWSSRDTVSPPLSLAMHKRAPLNGLAWTVDPNDVIEAAKDHPTRKHGHATAHTRLHQSWSRDEDAAHIPKYTMPKNGIPSRSAYHILHDEMNLDGNPTLNLASFVHTWMPEEATKLIMETLNK